MLHLYKNITPNTDDKHYYFTNPTQYKNALASNLVKSIALDNYRINTNVIKIALDNAITESIADTLTYAIDERVDNNVITYFRAYHVNRVAIQSGYVILYCSVDNWASYFYKASITNLNVTRCNRNIGTGLLDNIAGTKGNATINYLESYGSTSGENNELYDRSKLYIVFALKYNIQQNNAGSVSRIRLFALRPYDLVKSLYQAQPDTDPDKIYYSIVNPVELACDVVSGIYGIDGVNMWGISGTLNATIIGAWLTDAIVAVQANNMQIKSKAGWKNYNDITITPYEVVNRIITKEFLINNDYNKQIYVGTQHNGLKMQRTTDAQINCYLKVIASNDKMTFIMQQGDTQEDITSAFAVTLGTTDGDITTETQVLGVLQNSLKAVGSALAIGAGLSKGGAIAGLVLSQGITGMAQDIAGNLERSNHVGGLIKGGDGVLQWWRVYTGSIQQTAEQNFETPINNPYCYLAYNSINDEEVNVRLFGASFNELTTFTNVFNESLMGMGALTDTLIQANCKVDNIPTDASDTIKAKLNSGIYLVKLS